MLSHQLCAASHDLEEEKLRKADAISKIKDLNENFNKY